MKLSFAKRIFNLALLVTACLTMFCSANLVSAADAPCPYADDAVILFKSPSNILTTSAIRGAFKCQDARDVLKLAESKLNEAIEKELARHPDDKVREKFLLDVVRNETGLDSYAAAIATAYFQHVDGVVYALELPAFDDNIKDTLPKGLSLTYILRATPSEGDLNKLFAEDENVTILSKDNGQYVVKATVEKDGKTITLYIGGVAVAEMSDYVVIVTGSEELLRKKLDRFQATNKFITDRLAQHVNTEVIVKEQAFEFALKAADKYGDDSAHEKLNNAREILEQLRTFNLKTIADGNDLVTTAILTTGTEDCAQSLTDISNGGVAMAKLALKNKENPSAEAKFAVQALDGVKSVRNGNQVVTTIEISGDLLRDVFETLVWPKAIEACAKASN
ncbi:MAG: hypothetical protein Q4G03_08015 [Planctomycetia bacterium]|nr:hypothetical protein [Planctomycetia bacterium]